MKDNNPIKLVQLDIPKDIFEQLTAGRDETDPDWSVIDYIDYLVQTHRAVRKLQHGVAERLKDGDQDSDSQRNHRETQ